MKFYVLSAALISTHFAHLLKESLLEYEEFKLFVPFPNLKFFSKAIEKVAARQDNDYGPVYMESGDPGLVGLVFFLFSRSGGHKTKETYPTRPGSPTPCKQSLPWRSFMRLNCWNWFGLSTRRYPLCAGQKNTVILLLLDLLKAFETVDHYILLSRLKTRIGFEGKVLAWFTLYLGVVSLWKLKVANHWWGIYIMEYFKDLCCAPTLTSTSTLFDKNIDYNRLARKIAIANLGGPVKRKINWKEKEGKLQF